MTDASGSQRQPQDVAGRHRWRILIAVAVFPPYFSGTGGVAYHNAMELARRGHDVHVITPSRTSDDVTESPGFRVHRMASPVRIGNAGRFPALDSVPPVDLVHVHAPFIFGGRQVARFAHERRVPLVVTYHQDLRAPGWRGLAFAAHSRLSLRRLLRDADAIAVPTLDYARHSNLSAVLLGNAHLVEVPNGVDTALFAPGPPSRWPVAAWPPSCAERTLLFVGALDAAHYFKGVEILLKALTQVRDREVRLVIVGDGALRPGYQRLAVRLGLGERVHFAGRVAAQDLPDYYRATAATVLPSTNEMEIFGIVLVEAMACARPVIASDLPGVRTVVRHGRNGLLVPPSRPDSLADAIDALFDDPHRAAMGEHGRAIAIQEYTWPLAAERLEDLYAQVLR